MKSVFVVVYYNGDMISSSEGIMFECPSGIKVITIGKDMSLDALMKTIIGVIRGCRILLYLFYRQLVYIGDYCAKYGCMELKNDDDMRKMFFIFLKFSSNCPIELNATFCRSLEKSLPCCTNQGNQNLLMRHCSDA